jgi:hypothetical protein
MMSKNLYDPGSAERPLNQNNPMADDAGDGSRRSDTPGRGGGSGAAETPPESDAQDPSTIEAFDEEGAGIAPKE